MKNYTITPVTDGQELEIAKEALGYPEDTHNDAIYFLLELKPEHEKYDKNGYGNRAYLAQLPSFYNEFACIFSNTDYSSHSLLDVTEWMIEQM